MWQGQVWEARPDGESMRGKAKFGKRHGSRKWEEENSSTRRRHREKGRKRQKTPSPPYNVPHTPLGIRRAGCFLLLCISQTPEMHPRPFFEFLASAVVIRKGRIYRGIRRHPRVRWQICDSKWLLFRTLPCETWCVLGPSCVWGYLSSVNGCNFMDDLGVSDSIEISWLRYHVKTRARRGSSFSQLGLEPNHTGWTFFPPAWPITL